MGMVRREGQILMVMGWMGLSNSCPQRYSCKMEGIHVGLCYDWKAVPVRLKEKSVHYMGLRIWSHTSIICIHTGKYESEVVGLRSEYRRKLSK